jgi:hypothetical protein
MQHVYFMLTYYRQLDPSVGLASTQLIPSYAAAFHTLTQPGIGGL